MERRLATELRRRWDRDPMEAVAYAWWDLSATIKHWFSFHTMIPHEIWDFDNGTIRFDGLICWKCDHRE